ncbi:MAG TPA: hypothetical protein VHW26_06800 [Solirubrobacteraceae bacterium]|nr:hypothetical protein [Solirubrobacteraceae bacterium]
MLIWTLPSVARPPALVTVTSSSVLPDGSTGRTAVTVHAVSASPTTTVCRISVAGANDVFPAWSASITQVPIPTKVTVPPEIVHAAPVVDGSIVALAARPDDARAAAA